MNGSVPRWLRRNLFGSPFDAALSALIIPASAWAVLSSLHWAIDVAQWYIVLDNMRVLMVGLFPLEHIWRAEIAGLVLAGLLGFVLGTGFRLGSGLAAALAVLAVGGSVTILPDSWISPLTIGGAPLLVSAWALSSWSLRIRRSAAYMCVAGLIAVLILLLPAGVANWGGLLLGCLLTIISSVLTIPIGTLLAFGRRSRIPSVRIICTGYIELMRSVPLILIVYWVWIVFPLLAPGWQVPAIVCAILGFVLFYSAYAAEFVRSGLQSVPRGQVEAAQSLGLSQFDINFTIVLPQALRVSVPALVGNILDIFNYAPLIFIIGLTEFLRAGQIILANPRYSDGVYEIYVFMFVVYFVFGSVITLLARRLEAHLGRGAK